MSRTRASCALAAACTLVMANHVSAETVASVSCTKANLTRLVYLRADTPDGVPCNVLYAKLDEGPSIDTLWRAENDYGYCKDRYVRFVAKLQDALAWHCDELVPASRAPRSRAPTERTGAQPNRRLNPDGSVQITYPDGETVLHRDGGSYTTHADGSESMSLKSTARQFIPPPTPISDVHTAWLTATEESLLHLIRVLVDYDDASVNAYVASEQLDNSYERISRRATVVDRLIE
ncbi:MAG: hypothetical protein AAF460_00975 [Pseudomonadota bacterium]